MTLAAISRVNDLASVGLFLSIRRRGTVSRETSRLCIPTHCGRQYERSSDYQPAHYRSSCVLQVVGQFENYDRGNCSGGHRPPLEFKLTQYLPLFRLNTNVPVLYWPTLRLETDVARRWKIVLRNMGQKRSVQVIPDFVPFGNNFDGVPLSCRIAHFLSQFIVKREHGVPVHGIDVHLHVASALDFQRPGPYIMLLNKEQVSAITVEVLIVLHTRIGHVPIFRTQSKVRPEFFLWVHIAVRCSRVVKNSIAYSKGRSGAGLRTSLLGF